MHDSIPQNTARSTLPRTPGVYLIFNSINQHTYVGSTKNLRNRYAQHSRQLRDGNHHNRYLQSAYNLYGYDAFAFIVVDHLPDTSKLIEREQLFLDFIKPEYNIVPFADRLEGLPPDVLARRAAKVSAALTGQKRGKQNSEHLANRMASTRATKEAILAENPDAYKLSMKRDVSPEHLEKMTEAARIANTGRSRIVPPETQAKATEAARLANTGRKNSPEHIAKSASGQKATKARKRLENPDVYKPTAETIAKREATKRANRLAKQQELQPPLF